MASRYLNAKDLDIVLAGNVAKFRDDLKKAFPDATYEEIAYNNLDVLAPDLRSAIAAAAPTATPESLSRGNEILKAAAEAAGGAALNSVNSIEVTSSGKGFTPQGDVAIQLKTLIAFPDKTRSEVETPSGMIVQGFDGKDGWVKVPQGIIDLPPEYVTEFHRAAALAGGWGLYRDFLKGQVKAQYLGEEDSNGKKTIAVQWNAADGPIKLLFDPTSHLLVGAHYASVTTQGTTETDQQWSDFRTVDGRQYPYQTVVYRNGAKFSEATIQTVTVNPQVDASVFTKPVSPR
jgi:outer membrane lipoprotein-sorting protein